jgi:hypothetical protein
MSDGVRKFFLISNVSIHGFEPMLWFAPVENAQSFDDAYSAGAFPSEDEARASMAMEFESLKEAVEVGDLQDFDDDIDVWPGTLFSNGSIKFDNGWILFAKDIYGNYGIDVPDFSISNHPSL